MACPVNVCTSLMDRERAGVALSECRYWTLCVCVYLPTYIGMWWVVVSERMSSYNKAKGERDYDFLAFNSLAKRTLSQCDQIGRFIVL